MFDSVPTAKPDPIFNLNTLYNQDKEADKLNLGVGAYRTEEGQPYILPVVARIEKEVIASTNKEYLAIDGYAPFIKESVNLLFGKNSAAIKENRIAAVQSLSGTGALRLGADFLRRYAPENSIPYFSDPTWGNHYQIFEHAGFKKQGKYRYFDAETLGVDYKGFSEDLKNAPDKSIIVLHTCAHNPTGVDLTTEQWEGILDIIKAKHHIALFDTAYQGFATGDLDRDALPLRRAIEKGINEFLVTQSYAKNFGLYNARVGTLSIVCTSAAVASAVLSQLKILSRGQFSNPPAHGAFIVHRILSDPALFKEWVGELKLMSGRIKRMREELYAALVEKKTPGDWKHVTDQIGMFSYTGLTPEQVEVIINKHHVYMLSNGRISLAGLNSKAIPKLAAAIDDVVRNVPKQVKTKL